MGTLLKINGRVFEINNRENEIMKGWRKKRRMKPKPEPEPEQHEYVDLGLPSKTLWATENIKDADGNELFFAWGETQGYTAEQVGNEEGKRAFSWDDYKFAHESALTKYNSSDGLMVLEPGDDAATANWGEGWKMPTKADFDELTANTTTAFTEQNGVNGLLCTSTANTNTLFFPAVGGAVEGIVDYVGDYGSCWSTSLNDGDVRNACQLIFFETYGSCGVYYTGRFFGYSVRPIHK